MYPSRTKSLSTDTARLLQGVQGDERHARGHRRATRERLHYVEQLARRGDGSPQPLRQLRQGHVIKREHAALVEHRTGKEEWRVRPVGAELLQDALAAE